jgi:hypothetical protein
MTDIDAIIDRMKSRHGPLPVKKTAPFVPPKVTYALDQPGENWWCNSHNRRATHVVVVNGLLHSHQCDPALGGVLMMCRCVNLTGKLELEED